MDNSTFSGYKTRAQIAAEYGITAKTLKCKLEAKGIFLPNGRVSFYWQKQVYEALGYPPSVSKKDYSEI